MLNVHLPEIMKGTLQTGVISTTKLRRKVNIDAPSIAPQTRSLVLSGERWLRTVIFLLIPVRTPASAKTNAQSCFQYTLPRSNVAQMNKGKQSNM